MGLKIEMVLPLPPTSNTAYLNRKDGQGRAKTKRATQWKTLAFMAMHRIVNEHTAHCSWNLLCRAAATRGADKHAVGSIRRNHKGPRPSYGLKYIFWFPDDAARDIANYEKLLTDVLVDAGFMLDDQFVDELHMRRGGIDRQNPRVEIIFEQF